MSRLIDVYGEKPYEYNAGYIEHKLRRTSESITLDTPKIPEQEDCSSETIPDGVVNMQGKKKVYIPELITMNKILFDRYRLYFYSYLNQILRQGRLSKIIGERVNNTKITREQCDFTGVNFWRIDRESFYADVVVELKLDTAEGLTLWKGYMVCWCSFEEELVCSIEELTESVTRDKEDFEMLSSHLVPYATNKRVDEISERIWDVHLEEALTDPKVRNAIKLAEKMGLRIEYHPIYEHGGVDSILFFKEQPLDIGEDRIEKGEAGKKTHIKAIKGQKIIIPENTIVINTNRIGRGYSAFNIYHEIYHWIEHYLFFRLQEMDNNDVRQVKVREVIVDENYEVKDPFYFMEKQANRGAYGLLMPAADTKHRIYEALEKAECSQHAGELYQSVGKKLAQELQMPDFRIRARMIQLGNIEARGALNYIQRKPIRPFAFNKDSWREDRHTFVVEQTVVSGLRKKNPDLEKLMSDGKYIYADGHVVKNDEKYVHEVWDDREQKKRLVLTPWAEAHVDECCLRFVRVYVQQNVGRYIYGRMYCDTDYVKQTQFYLGDLIAQGIDDLDAKPIYEKEFPTDFEEALRKVRQKNGISQDELAAQLCLDDSTFKRWVKDRRKYRNEDFLTMICLILELPDWLSSLMFRRAGVQLDEDDRRQRALKNILRVQSADGINAANEFLKCRNLEPLSLGN